MKLTQADKSILLDMGYLESDFVQIEEATRRTDYEYCGRQVSRDEAISLRERRSYLVGIGGSAFHWSAVQFTPEGKPVYFDSSRLFKSGRKGYSRSKETEPLILEPDDWQPDEWATLCKLAGRLSP